ncbi:MAG: ATP-binding protein [Halothece sp.]
MSRILLLIANPENRRLLSEWIATQYGVVKPQTHQITPKLLQSLTNSFDLCILDTVSLTKLWQQVKQIKQDQHSMFLPFVLLTSHYSELKKINRGWEDLVDELINSPIRKTELLVRLKMLLRSRSMSLALKTANGILQQEVRERIEAENSLRQSELQFRQLVENIHEAFWLTSADQQQLFYVSPAYETLWDRSCQSLYDSPQSWLEAVHPEDRECLEASLIREKQGECNHQEFRIVRPNGATRWICTRAFPVQNDHGSFYRIARIAEDATDRKQAEENVHQALQAEKEINELKSRFVSMVSHEFRNPLNTISTATQILERYGDRWSAEKKKEVLRRIHSGVQKMSEMLEDMLLIGRADVGKLKCEPTLLDLNKFCHDLISELKFSLGKKHSLVLQCQYRDAAVVDAKLLRPILNNLLSNAIKYSPEGSKVTLKIWGHQNKNNKIVFQVCDQGIGIPEADQEQLFESFYRATNVGIIPGTGLGLAIVKRFVDLHGGAIAIRSEEGVGTKVTLILPCGHSDSPRRGDRNQLLSSSTNSTLRKIGSPSTKSHHQSNRMMMIS